MGFSESDGDVIHMAEALIGLKGEVLLYCYKLRSSDGERNIWSDGTINGLKVANITHGNIGMLELSSIK